MKYWDAANPEGLRFTGHNQSPVNAETDHDWWALGGPSGSCVHLFMLPKELTDAGIVRGTIFVDNATAVDSEDSDPVAGEHAVGYSLLNVVEAGRAGSFDTTMATVFLPEPYQPGAEEGALAMMNQPLRASVEPLERTGRKAHAIERGKNAAR